MFLTSSWLSTKYILPSCWVTVLHFCPQDSALFSMFCTKTPDLKGCHYQVFAVVHKEQNQVCLSSVTGKQAQRCALWGRAWELFEDSTVKAAEVKPSLRWYTCCPQVPRTENWFFFLFVKQNALASCQLTKC